jgi:peptide/nickel transport system ATP-binding protein
MAVVERLCHRVAVMFAGRILEIGSREQVLNNPCHAYTKRLLAAVPIPALDSKLVPAVVSKDIETVDLIRPRGAVLQSIRYDQPEAGHFVAVAV